LEVLVDPGEGKGSCDELRSVFAIDMGKADNDEVEPARVVSLEDPKLRYKRNLKAF
jgi:hypothetical protein